MFGKNKKRPVKIVDWDKVKTLEDLKLVVLVEVFMHSSGPLGAFPVYRIRSNMTTEELQEKLSEFLA